MITTIICPTDFSRTAQQAIDYGARLAQIYKATLTLINVQQLVPAAFMVSMDVNPQTPVIEKSHEATKALRELTDDIRKTYGIECNYEVNLTAGSISGSIAGAAQENALIVMGTDGAEGMIEELFGSRTQKVIRKTSQPVLFVPPGCIYTDIQQILFVSTEEDNLPLAKFRELTDPLNPQVTFLITDDNQVFEEKRQEIINFYGEESSDLTFWNRNTGDVISAIDEFMSQEDFDIVVVQEAERGLLKGLFSTDPVKALAAEASFPVLVIESQH